VGEAVFERLPTTLFFGETVPQQRGRGAVV
jgi:hypothetical protein